MPPQVQFQGAGPERVAGVAEPVEHNVPEAGAVFTLVSFALPHTPGKGRVPPETVWV